MEQTSTPARRRRQQRGWPDGYVLRYQDSKLDLVDGLKDGSIPEANYIDILEEDVADDLAAIYFSREPDEARHLLMANDVRRALAAGDAEGLSKLEGHRGFWDLAEDLLPEIGKTWDESPDATAKAGISLVETGFARMDQAYPFDEPRC